MPTQMIGSSLSRLGQPTNHDANCCWSAPQPGFSAITCPCRRNTSAYQSPPLVLGMCALRFVCPREHIPKASVRCTAPCNCVSLQLVYTNVLPSGVMHHAGASAGVLHAACGHGHAGFPEKYWQTTYRPAWRESLEGATLDDVRCADWGTLEGGFPTETGGRPPPYAFCVDDAYAFRARSERVRRARAGRSAPVYAVHVGV